MEGATMTLQSHQERRYRIMTIGELAKYLRLHTSTVYRMVRLEQIPASKIGHQWRFRKDVIDNWIAAQENGKK